MSTTLASRIVEDFEQGRISRRQLAARLMGLGAAMAAMQGVARAQDAVSSRGHDGPDTQDAAQQAQEAEEAPPEPTFRASGLHHIALDVTDVPRSRDFYMRHLGLQVIRGDNNAMFLGQAGNFFLTLFRRDRAGFHHYSYAIPRYDVAEAEERLRAAGQEPRRAGGRIYFPDPDGYTVQVSQQYRT